MVQETSVEITAFRSKLFKFHPFTCTEDWLISGGKENK